MMARFKMEVAEGMECRLCGLPGTSPEKCRGTGKYYGDDDDDDGHDRHVDCRCHSMRELDQVDEGNRLLLVKTSAHMYSLPYHDACLDTWTFRKQNNKCVFCANPCNGGDLRCAPCYKLGFNASFRGYGRGRRGLDGI